MLNNNDYQYLLHEIKNSVSIIGSSLQLIEKQHPQVSDYAFWKDTLADIERLRNLITESFDFQNTKQVSKVEVNLYHFLEQLYSAIQPLFDDKATIVFDTEPNLPLCYFDSIRVYHALLNIIKNASEAMNRKGKLTLHTYCCDSSLMFEISDNGAGMTIAQQEQIFQPFYSCKRDGTGLGLPLAKKCIESHNGIISVSSIVNKGTTFTIRLPLTCD